jgi:hypothetical protein
MVTSEPPQVNHLTVLHQMLGLTAFKRYHGSLTFKTIKAHTPLWDPESGVNVD